MLNIEAKAIATFGIKSYFKPLDRDCCRHALRLPKTKKLLLFTGRFMNDKGLETLLSIYSSLLQHTGQSLQLVISTSHIDPPYYNALVHQTQNTIIYYRLSRDHLIKLYNAADVYVSCALSIFVTYGKAPLEAIACGTPVIVPDWDGFPYYITPDRGWLAKVNFMDTPFASPYQFARIDQEDFSQKILNCLRKKQTVNPILPEWAYYDATLLRIRNLIKDHFTDSVTKKFFRLSDRKLSVINKNSFSEGINEFFQYHRIKLSEDLIARSDAQHFLVENYPENTIILKKLHNEIFMSTHSIREKMTCLEEM